MSYCMSRYARECQNDSYIIPYFVCHYQEKPVLSGIRLCKNCSPSFLFALAVNPVDSRVKICDDVELCSITSFGPRKPIKFGFCHISVSLGMLEWGVGAV